MSVRDTALQVSVTFGYQDALPSANAGVAHPHVRGVVYDNHVGASAADVDADLNSYRWELISCPGTCPAITSRTTTGGVLGSSADVGGPRFTPIEPGTYRLMLKVWDGAGGTATSTVDVTVL